MGREAAVDARDEEDLYWERAGSDSAGIVVATPWMQCKPRNFEKHARLYASCNWDSLISHSKLLNLWIPKYARLLAFRILDKLVQEVQERPRSIVFATFSGGLKACLYIMLQVLDGSYGGVDDTLTKYRILRDCYAGQIHDSSPVDFVTRNGVNFITHPTILGTNKRNRALTWVADSIGRSLDYFFLPNFEAQRAEMWTTLEISAKWGPILFFCSKDDDLACFEVIESCSSRLSSLGCRVTMIVWENSTHVAHFKRHPDQYRSAITSFLSDAAASFTLKLDKDSHHGFQSTDGNGSISGSATSSSMFSGQKADHQNQDVLSLRFESETYADGRTRFWIPSRM